MAGHEWDWFQREELIGQISDIRVQNLQVERENIQKRTFTRWINLHLEKCKPPLEVHDLFQDIQDGKVLMALLEVMSGRRLLHEHKSSSHRIFRLNNIAKSLKFLEDSNVRLISIDAAEIADGNPSMVLGLIWNIILFLQIKELTGNLNPMSSSSSMSSIPSGTDSDASFPSTPNAENGMSTSIKDQKKAIKALLRWVQHRTRKYGVAVQDFTCSWRSGLAFLALIKSIDSSLVDMNEALEKPAWDNLDSAFRIASSCLDIPRLLDPEDVMVDCPDEQSIMTYVSQFLEHFPEAENEDLSDNDSTIETRHVHYKDGPVEQEGKIITLNQSEEYAYTMSHDCLQPPPPKIYVWPETGPSESSCEPVSNQLAPSLKANTQGLPQETESQTAKPSQTRHGRADPPWQFLTDNVSSVDDNPAKIDEGTETSADPSLYDAATKCEGEDTVDSDKPGKSHKPTSLVLSLKRFPGRSDGSSYESVTAECFEDPAYPLDKTSSPTSESPVQNDSPVSLRNEEAYRYTSHLQDNSSKKGQPEVVTYTCESVDTPDQPILETPKNHTREGAVPKTPKGTAKVSVIPHDLFYYPHYTVPIADVLDAFLDSSTKYPSHSDQPHSFSTELDSTTLRPKNDDAFPCVPNTTIVLIPPKADEAPFTVSIIETRCNEKHQAISPEGSHVLFQDAPSKCNGEAVIPRDMEAKEGLFEDAVEKMAEKDDDVWETANGFVAPCIEPEKASSTSTLSLSSRSSRSDTSLRHRSSHKPVKEEVIDDWVEFKENDLVDAASSEIREIPVHRRSVRDLLTSSNPLGGPLTEDFIYLLVFMWLVVYGILILPELDLTKIAFFSQEQ